MTDKIRVIISNSQKEVKIPTGLRMLVRRCCNAVLRMENFQGAAEVSVTFANNEQIHELNKMHRNVDAPTDVLSFPMGEDGKYDIDPATNAKILGDIVISMEKAVEIQQAAKAIYRALDCKGFARVDLFLTPEGEIVFNEVNTIPGFTAHSRYPNMMKAVGLRFSDLISRIIETEAEA